MTSNGPCCRGGRSQQPVRATIGRRRPRRRSCSTCTLAEALALEAARANGAAGAAGAGRRADRTRGRVASALRARQTLLGQVEHDRDRDHVVLPCEASICATGCALRRWWRRTTVSRPRASRLAAMKCSTSKASVRGGLVVLVVGRPGRDRRRTRPSRRQEVLAREGRLAGARGADEHDEAELRDEYVGHAGFFRNTAIWVGGPTSGSSGPIGSERTAYPKRSPTPAAHARELGARPLEAVVRVPHRATRPGPRSARCTRRSAWSRPRSAGARTRRRCTRTRAAATARCARSPRPGSAASHPVEPCVAVGQRAPERAAMRCRRRSGSRSPGQPSLGDSSAREETSTPSNSVNARVARGAHQQRPSPQPRSATRGHRQP